MDMPREEGRARLRALRRERLRGGADIRRVLSSRRRYSCRGARIVVRRNELSWTRVAVIAARGFRRAVDRNRERRRAREVIRLRRPFLAPGRDMAVILYPGDYSYAERERQIVTLLRRAGLLSESENQYG